MNLQRLAELLTEMNYHYGRGDVVEVVYGENGGFVFRQPFSMEREVRKYRIEGNTVHFLGHQRTMKKEK